MVQSAINALDKLESVKKTNKNIIADNIKSLLDMRDINKSTLAYIVDKNPSEVSKWVSGNHNFTIDTLTEISLALRVDITDLIK